MQKASRVPMLVSLDGEWGLSMRLSSTTRFPKNMMLGAIEDNSLITEYGKEVERLQAKLEKAEGKKASAVKKEPAAKKPAAAKKAAAKKPVAINLT